MYDWYKLFNYAEFTATGLVQREYLVVLADRGLMTMVATAGNLVGVQVADVFLPVGLLDMNPFVRTHRAVYRDPNDDVWVGFEVGF